MMAADERKVGTGLGLYALPALAAALHAAPLSAQAADANVPVVMAATATLPITIDGRFDEPAWAAVEPITEFTQLDPAEGEPVSQPTEVRIVYDDAALYVAARLDGPVTYRLGRRDMPLLDSDWFGIILDSYHDHRTAFRFQVNPGTVQRDATITMAGGEIQDDDSWNAVWEVATEIEAAGWMVELRIPFSQLRFGPADVQTWGLQLERIIGRRGEYALFSFTPKSEPGGVPRYGHLTGLEGVDADKPLELLPYVVARGEYIDPGANPFRTDSEHEISAGLDLLYRVTSHLTLNGTINPDFGQVEVDPAIVNLGVYETFFPEKRPFFVEGSEIFRFTGNTSGGDLFYSRRIGRSPQLGPRVAAADVPTSTRIVGAAKLSGKTPDGWSIGVLDAVTAEEEARFMTPDQAVESVVAEPRTNYFVSRIRRDANGGRTSVGGIVTAVNRELSSPRLERFLRSAAYTGGIDFRRDFGGRDWSIRGSVAGTHVRGSSEAMILTQRQSNHYFQRPDAAHINVDSSATSLSAYSVGVTLGKQAGEHWTGSIAGALTSPAFEANDIGFQTRTDRRDLALDLSYNERQPGDFFRNWSVSLAGRDEANFDGDRIQTRLFGGFSFRHLDFWNASVFVNHLLRSWDDRSTRGGPMIVRPGQTVVGGRFGSDSRRPITYGVSGALMDGEFGGNSWEIGGELTVRTSPRWNVSLASFLSTGTIAAQYIATLDDPTATATYGRRYLFAPLDFTNVNANVRFNVTFLPRLTLELFAQPLIFSFDYGDVGALTAPRTFDFQPYETDLPSLDRTLRSLRGNAVLRWEWRPGSTIYLAWQQVRQGIGRSADFALDRDPRAIFETAPDNIVLVKMSYWINP